MTYSRGFQPGVRGPLVVRDSIEGLHDLQYSKSTRLNVLIIYRHIVYSEPCCRLYNR